MSREQRHSVTSGHPISVSPKNRGVYQIRFDTLPRPVFMILLVIHTALFAALAFVGAAAVDRAVGDAPDASPLSTVLNSAFVPMLCAAVAISLVLLPWGARYGAAALTFPLVSSSAGVLIGSAAHLMHRSTRVAATPQEGFGGLGSASRAPEASGGPIELIVFGLFTVILVVSVISTFVLAHRSLLKKADDAQRTLVEVTGEITDTDNPTDVSRGAFRRNVLVVYAVTFVDAQGVRHWVKNTGVYPVGHMPKIGDAATVRFDPLDPTNRRAMRIHAPGRNQIV